MPTNVNSQPSAIAPPSQDRGFANWCGRQVSTLLTPLNSDSCGSELVFRLAIIITVVIPVIGLIALCFSSNEQIANSSDLVTVEDPTDISSNPLDVEFVVEENDGLFQPIAFYAKEIFERFHCKYKPTQDLISRCQTYKSSGKHEWKDKKIFKGADCFVRHGLIHMTHVALMVPEVVGFYKRLGVKGADKITEETVRELQVGALFHDYGRWPSGRDLVTDTHEMELIGSKACFAYLKQKGVPESKAQKIADAVLNKDGKKPNLFQRIIHDVDSLAILRSDDWCFNEKFAYLTKLTENSEEERGRYMQFLQKNKRFLNTIGDSPHTLTIGGETIPGDYSLKRKMKFEHLGPKCFEEMEALYNKQI